MARNLRFDENFNLIFKIIILLYEFFMKVAQVYYKEHVRECFGVVGLMIPFLKVVKWHHLDFNGIIGSQGSGGWQIGSTGMSC